MNRIAAAVLALSASSAVAAPALATAAAEQEPDDAFWNHRFSVTSDVPYGERAAQKLDLHLRGSWVGEPRLFE